MNRFSTVIWMLLIVAAAFLLYMVKYQVQYLRQQVAQTQKELEGEKEALHVVAAEWAYLNRPDRLQTLARKYLVSSEMTVDQVADIQAIPFPRQSQASADMDDDNVKPVAVRLSKATGAMR
jgi:cell division protein FtsL